MKTSRILAGASFVVALLTSVLAFGDKDPGGGVSRCEDTSAPNNGWCLPADNGGQYCGSGGCNCTCDATSWPYTPGGPF